MRRISNTIDLAKGSWEVLKADKELMLLPVMSAALTVVVAATFLVPLFLGGVGEEDLGVFDYLILFAMYVAIAFVTIFFNAALIHAANERMQGGDPTLGSALRGAGRRAGRILPWAIVSATVSLIMRAIEERAGGLGRLLVAGLGVAWSLVTFLVVPILVIEDIGVVDAVRRSGALFKRTWGENMAAQFGFGLLGFLAALPAMALIAAAGLAGAAAPLVLVLGMLWIAAVVVVLSALSGIFQTALYYFAVDGRVPGDHFTEEAFASAFVPRKK